MSHREEIDNNSHWRANSIRGLKSSCDLPLRLAEFTDYRTGTHAGSTVVLIIAQESTLSAQLHLHFPVDIKRCRFCCLEKPKIC